MEFNNKDLGVIYRALDYYTLAFDEGRGDGLVKPDRIEDEWRDSGRLLRAGSELWIPNQEGA